MPYLLNPAGRMVALDEQQYNKYLGMPGFIKPTTEQVIEYETARTKRILQMKQKDPEKNSIYFVTVSRGGTNGYSVCADQIIKELRNLDVPLYTEPKDHKIAFLFHVPYSLLQLNAPYKILYTMFESDRIPDDWIDYLNAANKVIVPSKFCQQTFSRSGIKSEVVPLGYDDSIFTYQERRKRKVFTFLHYDAFNIRKGFTEVFKAFNQEFKPDEPVQMVFKTIKNAAPFPISKSQYPNIDVIYGKKSTKELLDILKSSDAFVFPSRGEGFGMTPLEAMATGLPTIVPNAHGIAEYFNSDLMYEVKVKETCPALYNRYKGQNVGNMVICDVDDLARQMRYIYEHQKEAAEKGKAAAEYVKQWTFKNTASKLKVILDGVLNRPIEQKPVTNVLPLERVRG